MATIKKFLENLSGQPEQQKQAEQEIALLVKMAEYKLNNLEATIRSKFLNHQLESQIEIVGDRLGSFTKGYRVNVENGAVGEAIKGIVEKIMLIGDVGAKEIIGGVITNALDAMFSSVGVQEKEEQLFTVVFAGMAMVRYDFYVWKYESKSNGLFKNAKSIIAYTYASSVIDHKKVSAAELAQSVYNFLGANTSPESVTEYVKKIKDAYIILNEITGEEANTAHMGAVKKSKGIEVLTALEALPDTLLA